MKNSTQVQIEVLVNHYNLMPHPEGGFYRQTYVAAEYIPQAALPSRFDSTRPFSTAIYFLLPHGNFSAFHRIKSDEVWHFYKGCPLNIHVIHPNGDYALMKLGNNFGRNESYQLVVPANAWFASEPMSSEGEYALVGCTVSPGFDFADFDLADARMLVEQYPNHEQLIKRLSR